MRDPRQNRCDDLHRPGNLFDPRHHCSPRAAPVALLADKSPYLLAEPDELGVFENFLTTILGQVHINDMLDTSGPRAHDRDPVGQKDGFMHIVGHKDDGSCDCGARSPAAPPA